jgi:hypothetical protein
MEILQGRMEEVRLEVNPNQRPRTVDVVFMEGPERGKVLKGIYEWLPQRTTEETGKNAGTGEALRICTFIEPHPERPDDRPAGFQAGRDVDTAIWECLSHDLTRIRNAREQKRGPSDPNSLDRIPLPETDDDVESSHADGVSHGKSETMPP